MNFFFFRHNYKKNYKKDIVKKINTTKLANLGNCLFVNTPPVIWSPFKQLNSISLNSMFISR